MRPITNTLIIKADERNDLIRIDTRFNPLYVSERTATVIEIPLEYTMTCDIEKGDKIIVSYLVCQPKKKVVINGEELYFAGINSVWGKIKGDKIVPVGDGIWCELVIDDNLYDGDVKTKLYPERVGQLLRVISTNEISQSVGINDGDLVLTVTNAGAEVTDIGLFYAKIMNVIAKVVDGEVVPLANNCIIRENPIDKHWNGLMVSQHHWSRFNTGTILKSNIGYEGRDVTYIHSMHSRLVYKGVVYCVAERRNLIFLN